MSKYSELQAELVSARTALLVAQEKSTQANAEFVKATQAADAARESTDAELKEVLLNGVSIRRTERDRAAYYEKHVANIVQSLANQLDELTRQPEETDPDAKVRKEMESKGTVQPSWVIGALVLVVLLGIMYFAISQHGSPPSRESPVAGAPPSANASPSFSPLPSATASSSAAPAASSVADEAGPVVGGEKVTVGGMEFTCLPATKKLVKKHFGAQQDWTCFLDMYGGKTVPWSDIHAAYKCDEGPAPCARDGARWDLSKSCHVCWR